MEQTESGYAAVKPVSLEEMRRQARENWLRYRQQRVGVVKEFGHSEAADRGAKDEDRRSMDDGLDD